MTRAARPPALAPVQPGRASGSRGSGRRWGGMVLLALLAGPLQAQDDEPSAALLASLREQARGYEHGEGTDKDLPRAQALYCEAARLGDAESQYSLGWMYANGRGVPQDDGLAALFFNLAAEQGHPYARKMQRYVGVTPAEPPECLRDKEVAEAPPPPPPAPEFVPVTAEQRRVAALVQRLAPRYGVDPALVLAVVRAESNFNPLARSDRNAQGLMQLIPETAARFNIARPYDPAENLRGGMAYLRWLLAYFQGDVALVAAAYNAGEGTVDRYRGIPPYGETRAYVARILTLYGRDRHAYDDTVTGPSPALPRMRLAVQP